MSPGFLRTDPPGQITRGRSSGPAAWRSTRPAASGWKADQGIGSRDLSPLAEKMTRPCPLPDGDAPPERIAPAEGHPTGEKHEDPQTRLPYLEQHRSIRVGAAFPETGYPGNVGFVQWGEDLAEPPFQVREFRTGRQRWQLGNEVVGVGHG